MSSRSSYFTVVTVLFQWFGYYKPGQDKVLYTMFESPLYTEVGSHSSLKVKCAVNAMINKIANDFHCM